MTTAVFELPEVRVDLSDSHDPQDSREVAVPDRYIEIAIEELIADNEAQIQERAEELYLNAREDAKS